MSTPELVNASTIDELADVIGMERLEKLIDRFIASLAEAFPGEGRAAAEVGREAHTFVSMAGMLGCDALSEACRTLEHRVKRGEDIAAPLGEARRARDATHDALVRRRGG
ncbi:Hpt domain-containing protein [Methylobacterium sp. J-076]|uniref:Hpt domain-containing protein n=1 Tax=Methylobacterium sp. J-076 TaxID=2836655 RepID=UPI001FBBD952|nr:Hpt domain-containing protein [Methylobacterium sp. J-076]MCJ2015326.1 Hpt domain-containing protein [Methylobacterium sp. J-076]